MSVQFNASEIKANLKFLFSVAFIISLSTFCLQLALMHFEKKTTKLYQDMSQTELEVSQYRYLVWLVHNYEQTNIAGDYFSSEYKQIQENLENSAIDLIRDHFISIDKRIQTDRLMEFNQLINHDECLAIMVETSTFIKKYRVSNKIKLEQLQARVDLINMLILALLTLLSFFFIYTVFYAIYGE
tara:strand:+ start:206 stop:760 length:555 start_codon:yes stop_codon:yes gene_type:complete